MHSLRILLLPLSFVYWIGIEIKNFLYRIGALNSWKSPILIICVGNISVGGQGKTPTLIALAKELINRNKKIAILSRGYKRKSKGYLEVNSIDAEQFGDEPTMIKMNLPSANVVVCENKIEAIKNIITKYNLDFVLMDDGLQNKSVIKDFSICVLDRYDFSINKLLNKFLIPAGNLRETYNRLSNYDAIIVNKKFYSDRNDYFNKWSKKNSLHNYFEMNYILEGFFDENGKRFEIEQIKNERNFIFCGIAKPESFEQLFKEYSLTILGKKFYSDHYAYKMYDFENLIYSAKQLNCDNIITTEKDFVRLYNFIKKTKVNGLRILHSKISANISDLNKIIVQTFQQIKKGND